VIDATKWCVGIFHRTLVSIPRKVAVHLKKKSAMFFLEYRSRGHRILVHILFWIIYFSLFAALTAINSKHGYFVIWFRGLVFLPVDIITTYITIYLLLPHFLLKKRYLIFAFLFSVLGFTTIFLNQVVSYYIYIPLFANHIPRGNFFYFSLWINLVSTYMVVIFAAGIKIAKMWLKEEKDKARLEASQAKSELALLKYQINPHFIFNTLNNIDTLIHTDGGKASESIMKLSEIMRYVTYESETDRVPIEQEISYLQSFLDLQQLRFGRNLIKMEMDVRTPGRMVAPMLFIPLVENAIKHGDKTSHNPAVLIKLVVDASIDFSVGNYLSPAPVNKDKVGGIGLKNLRRRLDLIYPGTYHLECAVNKDKMFYSAKLWIK
jgi:two-component system, LytTR family, sensor kinase